jgi:hypothetical protein
VAPTPQQIARFARLPQRSKDVWQGGVIRMPTWVDGPDGTPYRPLGAVWVSLETRLMNVKIAEPSDRDVALAVAALIELGLKFAQTRPTMIEVTDRVFGEQVAHALGDPELPIAIVPRVDVVKALVARMAAEQEGSRASREQLRAALRSNRYVPAYLTGEREWESSIPEVYTMGSRDEAVVCDEELGEAWYLTPGAVEWLASHAPREMRKQHRRR